ncbi:uncharacterized protein KIAA0895-like [Gigantopelta aegis]|uniref:uncharacterized protein KIAA0895-like n=1 Tax=Gigantopelta aegis TaxID=1735272 RepID=UPI001B88D4DB|nr:uncharacterized protein KIAA0895-like [Gigantopelta aegis]XP_041377125.1 uncharacterized protein KIAA0895-like [Gigantopelta aegis]XP_041377126.1 uncharacterized protein KIAA0895-like [Gigantopelta aegis]
MSSKTYVTSCSLKSTIIHMPAKEFWELFMPLKSLKLQDGPDVSLLSLSFVSKSTGKDMGQKRRRKKVTKKRNSLPSQSNKNLIRQSSASAVYTHNSPKRPDRPDCSKTKLPGITTEKDKDAGCKQRVLATPSPRLYFIPPVPPLNERRKRVPLLAAIKPDNDKTEKDRFMRANYNYNPYFLYRCPADVDVLESFSKPSDKYLKQAMLIMEKAIDRYGCYEEFEEKTGGKILSRSQICTIIHRYLKIEGMEDEICLNLSDNLISRGSMTRSKGRPVLNVRIVNLREQWAEGLLRHEIGTHYMRSSNNRYQPWNNWKIRKDLGLLPLNPTEEGLATLHSVIFRPDPCLWRAALLYYTAHKASQMSFKELFHDMGHFVHDPAVRWDYCLRAKRGQSDTSIPGAFCKDQVYLDGALQILKRRHEIDFGLLIRMGKIAYEDVDLLVKLAELEETRVPHFMNNMPVYLTNINRIAESNGLTDEILSEVE